MAKKKSPPTHVQAGLGFDAFVPKEQREISKEPVKSERVTRMDGVNGLNDWKGFGDYIKNLRGNRLPQK